MYKLTLIIRYLLKRRITHFAILAVALCVFIVVVVMTVMTGLVRDFKEKNHAFVGDCVVATESLVGFPYYEEFMRVLEQMDSVCGVSPVVKSYALLSVGGEDLKRRVEIMGIDPVLHSWATNFAQTLHYRAATPSRAFVPGYDPNVLGCILGIDMALLRNADGQYVYDTRLPQVAVSLTCFPLTAKGAPAKAGAGLVNTQRFRYSDHVHTGIARVDSTLVYVPLEQAQWLCMGGSLKRVNAIHVKFAPGTAIGPACERVADLWQGFQRKMATAQDSYLLDTVTVQSWKQYRRAFIAPMEKEQVLLGLMFTLVGVTTVFIVFVVFYMIISHKRKDIGVLKSIGASNSGLLAFFSGFALAVGLLGSCIGILGGWLFLSRINQIEDLLFERFGFQLWDRTIYAIGDIPHGLALSMLAIVTGFALLSCLIGALVPSYCAARLRPVETLHTGPL